jgi:hypothetical protein
MTEEDPLAALLVDDADEVDRAAIAQALKDRVGVDGKSGRLVVKPGFDALSTRGKVLAYLLGVKVAVLLGKRAEEQVSPKDVVDGTGMPAGSVRPTLSQLLDDRLVVRTGGEYRVPAHQVGHAIAGITTGRRGG